MDELIKTVSQTYIFPSVIFLVMFGLGAALNLSMLRETLTRPWALIVGLLGQLIMLPLIALLIATNGPWPAYVAISLIIISVCPGGSTSNAIVFALRGDVALSVSLTAIASVITLFSIPIFLNLGFTFMGDDAGEIIIPTGRVFKNLLIMVLLPVALGVLLNEIVPHIAMKIIGPMRKLSLALILFIIALSMYNARTFLNEDFGVIIAVSALLAASVVTGGFILAKISGLTLEQQMAIAIEVGIQNTPLAILIGATVLGQSKLALVGVVYGLINYALIGLLILYLKRHRGYQT